MATEITVLGGAPVLRKEIGTPNLTRPQQEPLQDSKPPSNATSFLGIPQLRPSEGRLWVWKAIVRDIMATESFMEMMLTNIRVSLD